MKQDTRGVVKHGATPALTIVRHAGVAFAVHQYTHDPAAASYGLEAAGALGLPPERVFKTLVTTVDGTRLVVALVPAQAQLNLKALAAAAGGKRAALAPPADAARATGYVLGGISPLGQKKRLPTFLDASALDHATIYVSGGRRGLELELAPGDLLTLTGGVTAPLVP